MAIFASDNLTRGTVISDSRERLFVVIGRDLRRGVVTADQNLRLEFMPHNNQCNLTGDTDDYWADEAAHANEGMLEFGFAL